MRHALLCVGSLIGVLALTALLASPSANSRWSMATAYVSLALWVVTLALGPLRLLRGRPNPVSTDLRRDFGIWAGTLGLVHVAIGLQSHMAGRWWLYFIAPDPGTLPVAPRFDAFGFANYTGLVAGLVLLLLLGLSNDLSLRRLGTRRWKRLQQASYIGFGLTIVHGFIYQDAGNQELRFVMLMAALAIAVIVFQALGARQLSRAGVRLDRGSATDE